MQLKEKVIAFRKSHKQNHQKDNQLQNKRSKTINLISANISILITNYTSIFPMNHLMLITIMTIVQEYLTESGRLEKLMNANINVN